MVTAFLSTSALFGAAAKCSNSNSRLQPNFDMQVGSRGRFAKLLREGTRRQGAAPIVRRCRRKLSGSENYSNRIGDSDALFLAIESVLSENVIDWALKRFEFVV
jgi:hypothetical protein